MTAKEILDDPKALLGAMCALGWILNRFGKDLHSPKRIQELTDSGGKMHKNLTSFCIHQKIRLFGVIEYSKA